MTANNKFVWTDLSTFDLQKACADYADLFSWTYQDDPSYSFAFVGEAEVAALFPMPKRLIDINMPSFWMSYIQVGQLDIVVRQAETHKGVIVEVAPEDFGEDARIALVRDPSGAGFTLYEGPDLAPTSQQIGAVTARYHHVDDIRKIEPFYRDVFGWEFVSSKQKPWSVFDIFHRDGSILGQVEEVPETIRGTFRYWMPGFLVGSVEATVSLLKAQGGGSSATLTQGRQIASDQQGAHFIIQEKHGAIA
ncbi:MAG: VOC family protein [Pseudomonadota bacterium]